MPVVWFDVPELSEPDPTDDLVALIKRYQWQDWRDTRFEERHSAAYRRAVAELARRLAEVNARLNDAPPELPTTVTAGVTDEEDETPGTLDILSVAMEAMPAWTQTLHGVGEEIQAVSALAQESSQEMEEGDKRGKGLAVRLSVAREFGRNLEPHSQRLEELGNDFTTHLYDVDGGVRALVAQAEREAHDDASRKAACEFFESVRSMAHSSRGGLAGLKSMVDSIAPVEGLSRDMRAPLRKMRKALTVMVEGQAVIDEWVRLIDESPIDCADTEGRAEGASST